MRFREAVQSDIDAIVQHSISRACFKEIPEKIDFVYTLEHEGRILVVGGFKLLNHTTCWAWMDLTPDAIINAKSVYRVVKEWLELFCKDNGIRRVMAAVKMDFKEAIRTVEHLGFHRESIMEHFYDNEDVYLYVRLME